ncbi:MAG: DUF1592 domain-containing protein [Gammaproteobacteria bacterium]|nr:DUF1592 domain-containing protein [Gammaproteobacteria bacterium]
MQIHYVLKTTIIAVLSTYLIESSAQISGDSTHQDTLNQYCVSCHNETLKTAGLLLDYLDPYNISRDTATWEKVLRKLRNRQMPPAGLPRPDDTTYDGLISHISSELDRNAFENPNPGRPDVHRLNRTEYANAIRDLLGLEVDSTELLPADEIGYGFDNIGDVLTISPFLMERYLSAAANISRLAIGDTGISTTYKTYDMPGTLVQSDWMGSDLPYGSQGGVAIEHHFPVDGEYLIKVKLQTGRYGQVLGRDKKRVMDIRLDDEMLGRFTIEADERGNVDINIVKETVDEHLEVQVPVKAGTHTIVATFVKDFTKMEGQPKAFTAAEIRNREQAFFEGVGTLSVVGPYDVTGPGETINRNKLFICHPSHGDDEQICVREIISMLIRRAYRRPITEEDLPVFLKLYEQGKLKGGFESGIRMALQKVLVSPEFLFRMEFDPSNIMPGKAYSVTDLDLASRLSFFLWSSIPDEELLSIAERGLLKNPETLQSQVQRMLKDPRSMSLIKNFAGQWLFLRNMERVLPDPVAFPNFDENLRQAMQRETEMLFESMLREDQSIVNILDSDYTFLNERLARHYEIKGIFGPEFRKVKITDDRRKGLLGQGSILTVTSYPNRTAPTIRGKWVLEQLLGTPPPPPPPDVPSLKEDKDTKALTMRQRMELHRANPACAVCHKVMDPLGFALENFDGLGRWRETAGTGTGPIDSSGILPDGTSFNGPAGLREVLLSKQDLFVETFTDRLLTYALGRGVEHYDKPVIRKIRRDAAEHNYSWSAIITGIVNSIPFQMRRASL